MARAHLLGWLLVLAAVAPVAMGDEKKPVDPERAKRLAEARERVAKEDAEFADRVNAAIDRGAAWLKSRQGKDGAYPGFTDELDPTKYDPMEFGINALVITTLAHCGVSAEDDAIRKCFDFCRFHYFGGGGAGRAAAGREGAGKGSMGLKSNNKVYVYVAATLLMAIDAAYHRDVPGEEPVARKDRYGNPIVPSKPPKCELPSAMKNWMEDLVDVLVRAQVVPSGGWRYPGNPVDSIPADTDISNTQYALLGLDVASRCGFQAPPETWKRAAEYLLTEQETEGVEAPVHVENPAWEPGDEETPRFTEITKAQARGWTYLPGHNALPTGAMTCAGVTGLALVKERLWVMKKLDPELSKRIDVGVLHGLTWLSEHFTVEDNPDPPNQWHYYYLYGLERTGAKCGVKWIGRNDWYRMGAEHLLKAQAKEGGWESAAKSNRPADNSESATTQTCFALLFLRRATKKPLIPVTPPLLTGGDAAPADNR